MPEREGSDGLLSRSLTCIILGTGVAAAVFFHVSAGATWPVPWPDEIDFLAPAAQLARHGSLDVPELNAPHGMFWVPDLYYVVLAPVLRLTRLTIDTGRWVSLVGVVVAAGGFFAAARRARVPAVPAAAVVAVWLLAPRVVIAGNIARQEALVLAAVAWALAATLSGRRTLALTLAALAALLHPAGVPFALALAVPNVLGGRPHGLRWEWCLASAVGLAALFQLAHLVLNLDVATEQLRFQLNRKADRSSAVALPVAVGVLAAAGIEQLRRRSGWQPALLAALAAVGLTIVVVGKEMWYEVYGVETAALLLALAALATLPRFRAAAVFALAVALFVPAGYGNAFYGMSFRANPGEWEAFVVDVRAALDRLDESVAEPTPVLVNSLSALPWPLERGRWRNLRLVKETEVTRVSDPRRAGFPYELFARGARANGAEKVPPGRVIAHVKSSAGGFDATLLVPDS